METKTSTNSTEAAKGANNLNNSNYLTELRDAGGELAYGQEDDYSTIVLKTSDKKLVKKFGMELSEDFLSL